VLFKPDKLEDSAAMREKFMGFYYPILRGMSSLVSKCWPVDEQEM
jgi:hypothetical protein